MCDPITAIMGIVGLASTAMTLAAPVQKPPAAAPPDPSALMAPISKSGDAAVKLGGESAPDANNNSSATTLFTERRKQGTSLGSLGRSGLSL